MSNAKYVRIGAFVVAGTLLGAAGIVTLGAATFGGKAIPVETYLDESVQGLAVGSPVKYRGVQVGKVESIDFVFSEYEFAEGTEEVYAQFGRYVVLRLAIEEDAFPSIRRGEFTAMAQREIERGLRARIASQGLTGVAYIEVDYLDTEQNPIFKPRWAPRSLYLPAAASTVARLTDSAETVVRSLEEAQLDVIGRDADTLIRDLTRTLNEEVTPVLRKVSLALDELQPTLVSVREASTELGPTLKSARAIAADLEPAARDIRSTTESLPDTARKANEIAVHADEALAKVASSVDDLSAKISKLVDRLDAAVQSDLEPTLADLHTVSAGLPEALEGLKLTLKRVDGLIAGEREDVSDVVASLRRVSQDLEQLSAGAKKYPSHVIFGNPPPQRERK